MTYIVDESAWILTYTGKKFFPLTPNIQDIDIKDIAHALSLICRFTGHVRQFYCVAQHCWLASYMVPPEDALGALLHDGSEAYLCDLSRPVKSQPEMAPYRLAERQLEDAIDEAFRVDSHTPSIKDADLRLLYTERRDLLPPSHWILSRIDADKCLVDRIQPWTSQKSEVAFLDRYAELTGISA